MARQNTSTATPKPTATPKTAAPKTAAPKTAATPKTAAPKTAAPKAAVVETPPIVEEATEASATSVVFDQFSGFMGKLQAVSAQMSALRLEFRAIERQVSRELKTAAKMSQKRKKSTIERAPSGFVKPALISNELAAFLGEPEGSELARTEVTKKINLYVKAHKLQNAKNGRIIHPDQKLATLLNTKSDEELTYFNLQKYMACHFAKASDSVAPASTA